MRRFITSLVLLFGSAILTRADGISLQPDAQSLPVSTTASLSGSVPIDLCFGTCIEEVGFDVLSGPDAGYSISFFGIDIFTLNFQLLNNGTPGTDVIQANAQFLTGGVPFPLSSNVVTITWTTAAPEPPLLLLLFSGIAGIVLIRFAGFIRG